MIPRAIKKANGNKALAAKALGISRKGLYLKQQRLDNDDPT
jgi:transcriptional regulator with PAS, ATPase and Fis domain